VTVGEIAQDTRFEAHAKPIADQVTVADALGKSQPNPEDAAEAARLVARASVLLGRGDIGAARSVLERAAETGSAQASFTLAETYDPFILPKWGTYGTRGDATKARDLYAKAEAGGIKEAKERFDALRR
jgi:TPR repeat protein